MSLSCRVFSLMLLPLLGSCQSTPDRGQPAPTATGTAVTDTPTPPIAKRVPHQHTEHGVVRDDPYFWMRDDDREDPEVLAYLEAENAFAEAMLAETKDLQKVLFDEMTGRIKQDDNSVPVFHDGYWHYRRFEEGNEHPFYCRKKGTLDAEEQILLDANVGAKEHEYYQVGAIKTTRAGDLVAWTEDTLSRRIYALRIKKVPDDPKGAHEVLDDVIEGTSGNFTWSNNSDTLYYTKREEGTLRAYQVWRHKVGTPQSDDVLAFEETDDTFHLGVYRTKSDKYVVIHSSSTLTEEARFASADEPSPDFRVFLPRERGHEHSIDHADGRFYVLTNKDAVNFKVMAVDDDKTGSVDHWEEVVAHRHDVLVEGFELFKKYLVVSERTEGNTRIAVRPWDKPEAEHIIEADEPAYSMWPAANPQWDTEVLRYGYESLITPDRTYDYNMTTRKRELLKEREVLGGFHAADYVSERMWATARDGTKVPLSIAYKKTVDRTKPQPLYLNGYGSYGISSDPGFSYARVSLLDRGIIYATAHVRGGSEMGRPWYDDGKLGKKMNSFTDFIDSARHLHERQVSTPAQTAIMGGSAGGLLVGGVVNMAPETFGAMIAHVPFVDVVTTMLDESIPLTTFEYDEWGNPNQKEAFDTMMTYSPYDNVTEQAYPHILVMTGLHDSQVQYWEPAKWVARLRARTTSSIAKGGDKLLLFKTNMEAGHGGASGRFKPYEEKAFETAFVLKALGLPLK
jgi:oligopeptidase B